MDFLNRIIGVPLGWVLKFCYDIFNNYGISILVFTIIMQFIMLYFTISQKKSQAQSAALQPETKKLQKMYKNNPTKLQEETQKLHEASGFKQLASCSSLLVQMPILFGLIEVIYKPIYYMLSVPEATINLMTSAANRIPGVLIDLSRYKEIGLVSAVNRFPEVFAKIDSGATALIQSLDLNFLGIDLTATPKLGFNLTIILPVLAGITALLHSLYTQHINKQASIDGEGVPGMGMMTLATPALSFFMGLQFPLGINLYWAMRSLVMIAQEFLINIFMPQKKLVEAEAAKMAELRKNKKKTAKKKFVVDTVDDKTGNKQKLEVSEKEYTRRKLAEARKRDAEKYGDVDADVEVTDKDFS